MKNLLLLTICLLLFLPFPSVAQWRQVRSNTIKDIADMYFKNADTGYCITKDGSILQSINRGEDWSLLFQDTGLYANQSVVAAQDSVFCYGEAYFGGWNQVAFSYKSGGHTKRAIPVSIENPVAYNGRISTDSFTYYNGIFTPHSFGVPGSAGWFRYSGSTVVGAEATRIFWSKDYGVTWAVKTFTASALSSSPYQSYCNADTLIAVTNYPAVFHYSYDRGNTWSSSHSPKDGLYFHFFNGRKILGTNFSSSKADVYLSSDGGRTFSVLHLPRSVWRAHFVDDQAGYLYGDSGVIYKTITGGLATSIPPVSPDAFGIAVYPNPATEEIRLQYNDAAMRPHRISLTAVDGREIASFPVAATRLSIKSLPAGTYVLCIATSKGIAQQTIIKR